MSSSLSSPQLSSRIRRSRALAEQLGLGVHRLGQPVGEEEEDVAAGERHLDLLEDLVEAAPAVEAEAEARGGEDAGRGRSAPGSG